MDKSFISRTACYLLCCLPLSGHANNDRFQFSGFASFGIAKSLERDELYGESATSIPYKAEYRDYNKLGLRFTADLQDNLKFTAQLLANGREDFEPEFDWIFLSYNLNPNLVVHLGKYVTSYFMYSDYADISYAYQWVSAPDVIYGGNINKTLEGAKLVWNSRLGGGWTSELSILAGQDESDASSAGLDTTMDMNDAVGFAWQIDRDWLTLRTSYMYSKTGADLSGTQLAPILQLATALNSPDLNDALLWDEDKTQFVGFGTSLNFDHVFAIAEIAHSRIEDTIALGKQNAGYLTVGAYLPARITTALTLYHKRNKEGDELLKTYDDAVNTMGFDPTPAAPGMNGVSLRDLISGIQNKKREGLTLSGRWDFHSNAAFKAEYMHEWQKKHVPGQPEKVTPHAIRLGIDLVF